MNPLPLGSLEIENFRVFDRLKIDRLSRLNLIIGQNNIGKSTLLEAIWLYANMGSPSVIGKILDSRGEIRRQSRDEPAGTVVEKLFFTTPLPETDKNRTLQIGPCGLINDTLKLQIVYGEGKPTSVLSNPVMELTYNTFHRPFLLTDTMMDWQRLWQITKEVPYPTFPQVFIGGRQTDNSQIEFFWEKIALTDAKQKIVDVLKIIDINVEDFAWIASEQSFSLKCKGENTPVPIKRLGDGINRIIEIGMALANAKNGILLIDEMENGIHWTVLPELWAWLAPLAALWNVQVFVTTHSADCLKSFYEGALEPKHCEGIAIRLERRRGKLYAEIFESDMLAMVVQEWVEVR